MAQELQQKLLLFDDALTRDMTRKSASEREIQVSMDDYATSQPVTAAPPSSSSLRARTGDFDALSSPLVAATQAVGAALLILVVVWAVSFLGGLSLSSEYPDQLFNLHPVLEVLGLVLFFGEAILSYRLLPFAKPTLKLIHTLLNGTALLLALLGLWAVLAFHNLRGIPNFYSLHSWFGLCTIILFASQWLTGLYMFLYPGAPTPVRQFVMPWHTFLGLFIFILALVTSSQGILEKLTFRFAGGLAKRGSEALLANFLGILIFVWGGLVLLTATKVDRSRLSEGYGILQ